MHINYIITKKKKLLNLFKYLIFIYLYFYLHHMLIIVLIDFLL